jgi:hypothetical protein
MSTTPNVDLLATLSHGVYLKTAAAILTEAGVEFPTDPAALNDALNVGLVIHSKVKSANAHRTKGVDTPVKKASLAEQLTQNFMKHADLTDAQRAEVKVAALNELVTEKLAGAFEAAGF